MPLPKSFTTVTTFSKTLALILFVSLPIMGYYLGTKSQNNVSLSTADTKTNNATSAALPKSPYSTENWPTYISEPLGITFKYPPNWAVRVSDATGTNTAEINIIPPVISKLEKYLPTSEKNNFSVTINKWPEQVYDPYILKDANGVYITADPKFPHNATSYSKPSSKGEYRMVYRQEDGDPKIQFPLEYTNLQKDAWLLKGNGDVIYVKPGDSLSGDKKFYDAFLSTFVFNDQDQATWETYTNKEYGFSIRYPKPSQHSGSDNRCAIEALLCVTTELVNFQLDLESLKPDQTLMQYVSSNRQNHTAEGPAGPISISYINSPFTISDTSGISSSAFSNGREQFGLGTTYLQLPNRKILIISRNNYEYDEKISDLRFEQILNTFKLTK